MPGKQFLQTRPMRILATLGFVIALSLAPLMPAAAQGTAAQLLREGNSYQGSDDTGDRAASAYRLLIERYPKSIQAEQAQFFLGSYYQKKFFILESRSKIQDWSSFNQAEEALYAYIGKYGYKGTKTYLADAYYLLAMMALRRGYRDSAKSLLEKMSEVADKDTRVYIYNVVWSPRPEDVIKVYCDTKALAAANQNSIGSFYYFNDAVRDMRNWCLNNCR